MPANVSVEEQPAVMKDVDNLIAQIEREGPDMDAGFGHPDNEYTIALRTVEGWKNLLTRVDSNDLSKQEALGIINAEREKNDILKTIESTYPADNVALAWFVNAQPPPQNHNRESTKQVRSLLDSISSFIESKMEGGRRNRKNRKSHRKTHRKSHRKSRKTKRRFTRSADL